CERVASRMAPEDVLIIRYEDVCREPQKVLNEIFSFVGLPHNGAVNGVATGREHILGNSMRLNSSKSILLDEKWKTDLQPENLEVFEAIAGSYNRSHGYNETAPKDGILG